MNKIDAFVNEQLKEEVPSFAIGDTVVVHNKIKEGAKERIQLFEGTVIAKRGGGISETFTVRRISYGVGVEKTFPLHSPNVAKVVVNRRGKVRRAKLYYLRDKVGKDSKLKEILWLIQQQLFFNKEKSGFPDFFFFYFLSAHSSSLDTILSPSINSLISNLS